MTRADLLRQRLFNQHLTGNRLGRPEDVVGSLCAVQAQEYPAATWALAQRTTGTTGAEIDAAFAKGAILRTHVMRPTWHFVTPADIGWLLALTGPRVNALCAGYYRKMDLDDRIAAGSRKVLVKALEGGRHLTRAALRAALRDAGVLRRTDGPLRMAFVMLRAELDGVVCSGPRQGRQFTYALLDERAPRRRTLTREEALAELVGRFFTSHGPAAVKDFAWWSGLTVSDTKAGLATTACALVRHVVDGVEYWQAPGRARRKGASRSTTAHLLPAYDEALLAYRDNRVGFGAHGPQMTRDNGRTIVIGDRAAGTWRGAVEKDRVVVEAAPFAPLGRRDRAAVSAAVGRYGDFLHLDATVVYRGGRG